jgi:pyruvate dehydrogenase E1 component beta subunit
MSQLTMVEAINSALASEMERDERVVLLGQDIGKLGGVFRATAGLQERFGSDRVVDMPLAEGAIIGSALGLALGGMIPVAEIQFFGFSHQAFHQLGPQLGRYRFRSRGRFSAQVTIRVAAGGGVKAPEFHSDSLEAELIHQPGIKVVCPSNPYDAKGLLLEAIRDPDPVIYIEPQRLYRLERMEVPDEDFTVPIGVSALVREGSDLVLVAWSAAVELSLKAADKLAAEGINAAVLDLRSLVPLDVDGLVSAVRSSGKAMVVHEAPLTSGFGAEISATLQEEAYKFLDAPVFRVAAWDTPYPPGSLEKWYLPTVERVVARARELAHY